MLIKRQMCIRHVSKVLGFILVFLSTISAFKLNTPRILVAYNYGLPSNYTLEISQAGSEDCFLWNSENNHVVVSPLFDDSSEACSRKAIVSVLTSSRRRSITKVTAVHKGSSENLHCDVIMDSPKTIQLSWITDELHLGGPPEILTVIGLDEFGHTFSSINGLQFQWDLTHEVDDSVKSNGSDVAKLLKFNESNYSSAVEINGWEDRGLLGHSVLVYGLNVGSCFITATLLNFENQELTTPKIKLNFLPNIKVYPSSSITLLRLASVDVYMHSTQDGKRLENECDHSILADSTEVVSLNEDSTMTTGLEYGSTHLVFKSLNSMFPEKEVHINVVKPASIAFRISRGGFTNLEELKTYIITVEILDDTNTEIYPSDNLRVMVSFPTTLFYVHSSTPNGTHHVVQTVAPGKGIIRAELRGVLLQDGSIYKEKDVIGAVEVRVFQKLEILPRSYLLPSDSVSDTFQTMRFMVFGGTGSYLWASSNISAVSFHFKSDKSSTAFCNIRQEGDFYITVSDKNNVNAIATAKLSVQPVIDVQTFPTVVEAEVGNTLILPVALLAYECKEKKIVKKFDDCSTLQPTVEIIEKHVIALQDGEDPHLPGFGQGCLSLQFKCKSPGHSRINIFYQPKTGGSKIHKTTTVVACFKPLKPVHPVRIAVLPVGASKEVAFEGGPRKWPLFKEGHYTTLMASDPALLDIKLIKDPIRYNKDLTVFRVLCKALGQSTLTFSIGNEASATNVHPAKEQTTIKVICSEPSSVHLKLFKKSTKDKLDENIVKVPFYGTRLFEVDVWLKDSMGLKLANISSLNLQWDVSDEDLAVPESSSSGVTTHENGIAGYRKVTRDFKEFQMKGGTGKLKVKVQVKGYLENILQKENISPPGELKEISGSIDLNLVSLRDINAGLYSSQDENEGDSCDGDTCKS